MNRILLVIASTSLQYQHIPPFRLQIPDWNNRYFLATRVSIFVGIFQAWFAGWKQETAEELIGIMNQQAIAVKESGFIF